MLPNAVKLDFFINKEKLLEEYNSLPSDLWQNQVPFFSKDLDFLNTTVYHQGNCVHVSSTYLF